MNLKIKDITVVAVFAIILFVQEEMLNFLPNISLTVFLIILFSKKLGFKKTVLIILVYCLLDNLVMNSFNVVFTPFMFLGWLFIPFVICVFNREDDNVLHLSIISVILSFSYCVIVSIPSILIFKISASAYFVSDLPFMLLLALSSFLSILWFYEPCSKAMDKLLRV